MATRRTAYMQWYEDDCKVGIDYHNGTQVPLRLVVLDEEESVFPLTTFILLTAPGHSPIQLPRWSQWTSNDDNTVHTVTIFDYPDKAISPYAVLTVAPHQDGIALHETLYNPGGIPVPNSSEQRIFSYSQWRMLQADLYWLDTLPAEIEAEELHLLLQTPVSEFTATGVVPLADQLLKPR